MRIRHLSIKNFRGIKELDWTIDALTVCLIGGNNSTKTTILDAIDLVLSSRWNPALSDSDFYLVNADNTITIEATVSNLPDSLMREQKYGGYFRGWNLKCGLVDEPGIDDEPCLTVQLTVDKTLEPKWLVINDRLHGDERRIHARDREQLGISKVGSYVDRDLTWGRGTALARLTASHDGSDFASMGRTARDAIKDTTLEFLLDATKKVEADSRSYGIKPECGFRPLVDSESLAIGTSTFSIHDGDVPVKRRGLGDRRLVSLAMQKSVTNDGTILLIDELEHGLEPYRIRNLVRLLRVDTGSRILTESKLAQVFFTTHSSVAIEESYAAELHIVRNDDGIISVNRVTEDLQAIVRTHSEALLTPRLVVCEGKTELGLLRYIDSTWQMADGSSGMTANGVCPIFGGGSSSHRLALALYELGYEILLFVDDDVLIDWSQFDSKSIEIVKWADSARTETRIFSDLPACTILKIVCDVLRRKPDFLTRAGVQDIEQIKQRLSDEDSSERMRQTLADAANELGVFKRIDHGEELGNRIVESLESIPCTDLYRALAEIRSWVNRR